jgi:hypothetical protein
VHPDAKAMIVRVRCFVIVFLTSEWHLPYLHKMILRNAVGSGDIVTWCMRKVLSFCPRGQLLLPTRLTCSTGRAILFLPKKENWMSRIADQAELRAKPATHLLDDTYSVLTVQELLGHSDVRTTMIYTHVLNRGPAVVRSPVGGL